METKLNVRDANPQAVIVPPELYQRVLEIVAEKVGLTKDQIVPDTALAEHGDSLDLMDITMQLEEEFEFRIPDEDAQELLTVGQIAQYVAVRRRDLGSPSPAMKVPMPSGESPQSPL